MEPITTELIKIGNSRGIRIPKLMIDQLGLTDAVELTIEQNQLVIRSARQPRQGWNRQFQEMAAAGDDRLLDPPADTKFDAGEWQW